MLGTVLYYHLCSFLRQKIVFGVPLDDALRKLVPRHPWPTCPCSSRRRRTWGLILQLKLQGPPGRTSEVARGLLGQVAGCRRCRGGPADREESRCPGRPQEVGRSPRGCCRGCHILTPEIPRMQFTKQREVCFFVVVFFRKPRWAMTLKPHWATTLTRLHFCLVIHCLSCILHFKF